MIHNRVLLFLHIPKTGGTTLSSLLYHAISAPEYYDDPGDELFHAGVYWFPETGFFNTQDLAIDKQAMRALGRPDLRALLGHFWFGVHHHLGRPFTYMTLLRRPIDRVISLYYHIFDAEEIDEMTLEEFLMSPPYREIDNDQTLRISGFEPPLGECSSEMLTIAKDNIRKHFSFVGVTERFDESLVLLKMTLGWSETPPHIPKLINFKRPKSDDITETCVQLIQSRNALDMQLYDFAVEHFEGRIRSAGQQFQDELAGYRERNAKYIKENRESIQRWGLK